MLTMLSIGLYTIFRYTYTSLFPSRCVEHILVVIGSLLKSFVYILTEFVPIVLFRNEMTNISHI